MLRWAASTITWLSHLTELYSAFINVGSKEQNQVPVLTGQALYPLSHLHGSTIDLWIAHRYKEDIYEARYCMSLIPALGKLRHKRLKVGGQPELSMKIPSQKKKKKQKTHYIYIGYIVMPTSCCCFKTPFPPTDKPGLSGTLFLFPALTNHCIWRFVSRLPWVSSFCTGRIEVADASC